MTIHPLGKNEWTSMYQVYRSTNVTRVTNSRHNCQERKPLPSLFRKWKKRFSNWFKNVNHVNWFLQTMIKKILFLFRSRSRWKLKGPFFTKRRRTSMHLTRRNFDFYCFALRGHSNKAMRNWEIYAIPSYTEFRMTEI